MTRRSGRHCVPRLAQVTAHVMANCCRSCSRFCLASFLHVWFMAINVFVDISYVLFSSCMFKADYFLINFNMQGGLYRTLFGAGILSYIM